ncbi:MAG TPA: tetratricopeptide repeat protein [Opitutaceae bacterium]|nr:tetratricopeptide repeat protein [Opitutaceae bacterium]
MKGPSSPPRSASVSSSPARRADLLDASPFRTFALLLGLVFVAYFPALSGGMLWDDAGHVTRPDLRSLDGLARIWFEVGATQQYYPVLHSAFWFEHLLWGDATLGYHLVNIFLHATAAFLFGLVLRRLAVPGAWLAALLFALHPVAVESVAWISEQKNTLSAVFYLAAALAYFRFDAERRPKDYAWATALFALAILAKTVTATLPAALLVVFWFRRGRIEWRRDVQPLLPWFAAALVMGAITAHFEHELIGARGADFALGVIPRLLLAGRVTWFYLGKLLWPADLLFVYPRWSIDASSAAQWIFLLTASASLVALAFWSRRQRAPLAVALLFGGTLFPVLGFFNVYPFVFSYVADHFQYLASLAIFAAAAAILTGVLTARPAFVRWSSLALLLALLGGLTWQQSRMYRDVFTLYETTLRKNPRAWLAHHNLALALAASGRVAEALPHAEATLALKPDYAPAENNLGDDLLRLGRAVEAIPHLERAIALQPDYVAAHRNLGFALAMSDRTAEALSHFQRAVQLDPNDADAELNWALGLMFTQSFEVAEPHFRRALALAPASADFHVTYGRALARAGRLDDAIAEFRAALAADPNSADAHAQLADALRRTGRASEAEAHLRAAPPLAPK